MRYSVWSRGRLIGETELAYVRVFARQRMGDFFPTGAGERLMPLATGISPAMMTLGRMRRERERMIDGVRSPLDWTREIMHSTAYADLAAAFVHCESLDLELRGPDGAVIPTESIHVQDTQFLLSLAREVEDEDEKRASKDPAIAEMIENDRAILDELFDGDDELLEADGDEPWKAEIELPRYQIQVRLVDGASVP